MKSNAKKSVALAIAGLVITGGAGVVAGAQLFPKTVTKEVVKEITKEVPVEVIKEVEKVVEVEKEVPVATYVDNGRLEEVLDFILDRDGDIAFVTEDLDDGEASKIADLVIFANEFESIAINKVRSDAEKELHKEVVESIELDKDDIKSLKIKDEDIEFDALDLEEGDLDILVPVTFRQDEDRFEAVFRVSFVNGDFDDFEIESLDKLE